jgi:hypothetical protein
MAYQVKTTTNYGNRLLGALKGVGTGFILLFIGTIMLCANEGNYVKNYKTIGDAQKALVKRTIDVSTEDSSLDGKLIYAHGFADTKDIVEDELFGVSEKAIAVVRLVEYYQYQEHKSSEKKDKLGGSEEVTTTYTYEKKWVTSPINSSGFADPDFKGKNFILENEVKSQIVYAKNVTFGAYKLPRFIIEDIRGSEPVKPRVSDSELAQWNNRVTKRARELGIKTDSNTLAQIQGNIVYFGKSSSSPQVGDVRITLGKVVPADISIIAKVVGNTFEEFTSPSTGRTFYGVEMGTVSADAIFAKAINLNKLLTWILRFLGIFLVVAAFKMIFKIFPTLFKVLPPLASIVGAGVTLVCSVGGFAWSLVVISLAWLFYRPLIGIPLLLVAGVGIWFLVKKGKEKKASAPAAAEKGTSSAKNAATDDGWKCSCGTVNKGKFCADCGKPKPAGVPQYKCDKCGWEPKDMTKLPKFCPDCGDPFDDGDIVQS